MPPTGSFEDRRSVFIEKHRSRKEDNKWGDLLFLDNDLPLKEVCHKNTKSARVRPDRRAAELNELNTVKEVNELG